MTCDDFEVNNVFLSGYIQAIGGYDPSFPSSDSFAEFWDELMHKTDDQVYHFARRYKYGAP
jgi:hypothetical protein